MAGQFIAAAQSRRHPAGGCHRVALDGLRRHGYVAAQWGAVITLLAVTGLTHRESYRLTSSRITCIKTVAVFCVIGLYYATA